MILSNYSLSGKTPLVTICDTAVVKWHLEFLISHVILSSPVIIKYLCEIRGLLIRRWRCIIWNLYLQKEVVWCKKLEKRPRIVQTTTVQHGKLYLIKHIFAFYRLFKLFKKYFPVKSGSRVKQINTDESIRFHMMFNKIM